MLLLGLASLHPVLCMAQKIQYADTKEKVYVQTSHVFFNPGETMYFKVYVVNANSQRPTFLSNVVYTEILGPSGNVVQKMNYGIENGYAEGSFDFSEEAPGGMYKIKAYTTWMRNENENTFFVKEITLMKVIAPRVLMKLDFPEKGYGAGDEVKADFSMRNLDNLPIRNQVASFKVSIGGEVVRSDIFQTDDRGKALLRFSLPKILNTTDGLLNITVQYDAYTESVSRSIPIVLNKIDLQFMPEGGTLVQGITGNMAFRAVNEHGNPVDVKGAVLDSRGNKVAAFESLRFGMGKFTFTPQKNEIYSAAITTPANIKQPFPLPPASAHGMVMKITNADSKALTVKIASTQIREVLLVAQTKNTPCYTEKITVQAGENTIAIDNNKFPAGIARFTLFTDDHLPVAERLIFLNGQKNLQVGISTDKPKYFPREKVTLTLKTFDEMGNPVPANLSLAVLDDKLWTLADDRQDNILSWLLMSSELKGKIEEPNFYFKKEEPLAAAALDLVMLTHGYRYFDYTTAVEENGDLVFKPDQPHVLSGVVVNTKQKPVKASVFLVHHVTGGRAILYKTGDDGVFFFSQLYPKSDYYVIAQSYNKREKINIKITQNGMGYNPIKKGDGSQLLYTKGNGDAVVPLSPTTRVRQLMAPQAADKEKQPMTGLFDNIKPGRLDEVVIIAYGTSTKGLSTGNISIFKGAGITPNVLTALQGRVAGLYITPVNGIAGTAENVKIRGVNSITSGKEPLIIIDGVPAAYYRLTALEAGDIDNIEILKDATATAIYGSRAAFGVIIVSTKKTKYGGFRIDLPATEYFASQVVRTADGPAFKAARRFYAPKYLSIYPQERTDFRETIYWNPVIQTDKTGTARVEFYNSDANTTFRAIAEGIGYNGRAGRAEHTYITKNALQVDAKIPPYLSVGDHALIPLVIKNNSIQDATVRVTVTLPPGLKTGSFPGTIRLPADSSQQLLIPIKAMAADTGIIEFVVETGQRTETVKLPVTVAEKGFPVIETLSGNRTGRHEFTINNAMAGSIRTELKLFKTLEGQLLDGIESMLREPYGCFEQTSSSTYPNVFILKYLRESKKVNPAVEKKALDYIEKGYRRLIGFETAMDGFEWFGKTPPHEALTAYGLLEFTDMQEFVDVNKKMLERTKAFLLRRRDGNGSFKLSSGGYDRFASVPDKIANIYIVYALTQAGIGKEIVPEYEAAFKHALECRDGYKMAMMALAASNMKRTGDYRLLMDALQTAYQKNGLASQTSVVNSRDASLRVETAALYALALMRAPPAEIGIIANLITKVLGEKSYYGYGSTQATVLALKAIVEYSKLIGKVSENPQITFIMNETTVGTGSIFNAVVNEGKNVFGIQYQEQASAVPYSLQVAYNTFTPPNSEKAELKLTTRLAAAQTKVGETMRMDIEVTNTKNLLQPMAIAKIGIPAGLSVQPWQLKELMDKDQVAYYEIFDNYLVLYWMGFAPDETKTIRLDLKAEIAGTYKAKASNAYLYYMPEYKYWNDGVEVEIR